MRKLLLFLTAGIGALLLVGCYKDDLKEFQSIKQYRVNHELAVPLINQTLDTGFYNPFSIPIPGFQVRLADTVSIELPAQDTTQFIIEEVTFKALTNNHYTGNGAFSIIFLDSLNVPKDTLPDGGPWLISAGPNATNEFELTVDRERYDYLRQYSKLILQVDINTGPLEAGFNSMSFTYYLGIKLKGSALLNN